MQPSDATRSQIDVRVIAMAASQGTDANRHGTLVGRPGSELRIYLRTTSQEQGSCSTVHITLSCPTAAAYTPG
jgi:hypothetical protein